MTHPTPDTLASLREELRIARNTLAALERFSAAQADHQRRDAIYIEQLEEEDDDE